MNLSNIYEELETVDEGVFSDAAKALKNKVTNAVSNAVNRVSTGNASPNEPDKGPVKGDLKTTVQNFTNTGIANKKKPLETAISIAEQVVKTSEELKTTTEPTRQTALRNSIDKLAKQYYNAYLQIFKYLGKFPGLQKKYGEFNNQNYKFSKMFVIPNMQQRSGGYDISPDEKILQNLKVLKQDIENIIQGKQVDTSKKQVSRKDALLQKFNQMSVDLEGKYTPEEIKKVYIALFGNKLNEDTLDIELSREEYLAKALGWFLKKYLESKEKIMSTHDKERLREVFWEKYQQKEDSDETEKKYVQKALKISTSEQPQQQPQNQQEDNDVFTWQKGAVAKIKKIEALGKGNVLVAIFSKSLNKLLRTWTAQDKPLPKLLLGIFADTFDPKRDRKIYSAYETAKDSDLVTKVQIPLEKLIDSGQGTPAAMYSVLKTYLSKASIKGEVVPEYFKDSLEEPIADIYRDYTENPSVDD